MNRRGVSSDHWSFLEEIEAPMWVDLTLEVGNNEQERADEWFSESHLFHQCSSRQLKSTFSHLSEENGSSDFYLHGPFSPKLPSSVSKSRGKDYRGKKWEHHKTDPSVHQSHPVKVLSATSSCAEQCSYLQSQPNSRLVNLRGPSGLKKNLITERNFARNGSRLYSKPTLPGSTSNNMTRAKQKSGISFESHQQQEKKVLHVSGQAFGNSTGQSSIIRMGIRKSCVTRQASRVEINSDMGHRSGHKSSNKSSVGSSSYPFSDANCSTSSPIEDREITPDSRHPARTSQALLNKKESVISGVSSTIPNTSRRGKSHLAKPGCSEAAKPKLGNVRGIEGKAIKNVSQKGLLSMR